MKDTRTTARSAAVDFVLELGRALHIQGASSPEIEYSMTLAARKLGLAGEFFATPTSIFASFLAEIESSASASTTHLLRVVPGGTDLAKRARVDEILRDVLAERLDAEEGRVLLAAVAADPPHWPRALVLVCSALSSAAAARFFGLDAFEIALAGGVGLAVELLALVAQHSARLKRGFLPLAAFLAAAIVALASGLRGEPTPLQVVVAGLITLLPGLRITTAMIELALDHLAAGTARFFGSLVSLIAMLFGAALGADRRDRERARAGPGLDALPRAARGAAVLRRALPRAAARPRVDPRLERAGLLRRAARRARARQRP
ncbi:MAG: threonine/serine exporter family protein [Planctomycetes bacterium]|nr:threonine/serine exporter family protein [Planctomycetota bacterium]